MNKIKILPYSKSFPRKFERVKNRIMRAIGREVEIHHVGSTAIPGMPGKGVIDILIGVGNWKEGSEIVRSLRRVGFVRGEANRGRVFLSLRKGMKDTHVHIVRKGTKQCGDFLKFRDYLRTHSKDRKKYLELKKTIYPLWRVKTEKYVVMKDRYVKSLLSRINRKS